MYRPEWFVDIAKDRNVLTIALDVRCTVTGALDRGDYQNQLDDVKVLNYAIDNWDFRHNTFDLLVYTIITEALILHNTDIGKNKDILKITKEITSE